MAIHGISTELAVADGIPAPVAVAEITDLLEQVLQSGTPLVIMNAPFDLTILDRECRRYGVVPLSERLDTVAPVIDPLILDRHIDRYRRGNALWKRSAPTTGSRTTVHMRRARTR